MEKPRRSPGGPEQRRPRGYVAAAARGGNQPAAYNSSKMRAAASDPPPKRNLEDLWSSAFPVGTEWVHIDKIKEFNWNFENLERTLEEGGDLYGKTVYLFGSTEPQCLDVNGEMKMVFVPVVVAVDCPFPPSDRVGIASVQREIKEVVPMKAMKMAWVPYVPIADRLSRVDRLKSKIFTLCCYQRRSALKLLETERVKKFDYCIPYYMPLNPEEDDDTVVHIMYPVDTMMGCDFDWDMDDLEEFADEKVNDGVLPEDEREKFKEFVKERVRERKRELKQAKEARRKAIDAIDPTTREAFENIKFYKFYPVKTPDTPSIKKSTFINRYYLHAHYVK